MAKEKLAQVWAREQQHYNSQRMRELLGIGYSEEDDKRLSDALQQLKCAKILRTVVTKSDEANETEDDDADSSWDSRYINKYEYCFRYVGLIQFGKRVLYILPKYCAEVKDNAQSEARMESFRTVMRVIARYKREASSTGEEDSEDAWHDFLHVMVELVMDFQANGVYRVDENINELNGKGRIMWPRTIRRVLPLMQDGRPYYMELHTRRKQADTAHIITRLHKYLVWQAWQKLEELHLSDLLELPAITDPPDHEEEFSDLEYLVRVIKQEQTQRFDNRRKYLLDLMLRYLEEKDEDTTDGIYLFGKSGFHVVWEEACRVVFGMEKSTPEQMEASRPIWDFGIKGELYGSALEADMLKVDNNKQAFTIYDAKYYIPPKDGKAEDIVKKMPGGYDVIKQQLYELALKSRYPEYKITKNVFILPMMEGDDSGDGVSVGTVRVPMLEKLGLAPVEICKVKPDTIWNAYLNRHTIKDIPK